ncbi:MAG: 4'-phosphopantetheinyl transferase [Acidobacteria bacterium]|nr:4'-phosphopantetheinyl transferase [Acidobacteriota bacterium]
MQFRISNLEFRIPMSHPLFWLARKSDDVPENNDWLSDAERDTLAGFRFPKRRNDWRLGRWTAKQAVCAYQSLKRSDLASLEIRAAGDGVPEAFSNGTAREVSISISHSSGQGFCVVGPPELSVGCDTEMIQPHEVQFFQDYFTAGEISLLQHSPADRSLVAYLIWCAKESALKALREGLRLDTRSIAIVPDFEQQDGLWHTWTGLCQDSPRTFRGWWRSQDGFIYAMTADQPTSSPVKLSTD